MMTMTKLNEISRRLVETPSKDTRQTIFYSVIELTIFSFVVTIVSWYVQSTRPIVEFMTPPKVVLETNEYFDIEWHTRLLLDCPTTGYPIIYTNFASEHLPVYGPLYSTKEERTFTRRYYIPTYIVKLHNIHKTIIHPHTMELRLTLQAKCNPLWDNQQLIVVPFDITTEDTP
jgi:hypothetical protein